MDKVSKETRSEIMAKVHSRNNRSTERKLRSSLAGSGISGYKLNVKELPGVPDFVFPKEKVAVFVDGCFWHGCPHCYRRPHSSRKYWDAKVKRNMARDRKNRKLLLQLGWTPVRIWEHSLESLPTVRKKILSKLKLKNMN
jgi:DNA mismatch endonuclease, patch repair protein